MAFCTCLQIFRGENNSFAEIPVDDEERKTSMWNFIQTMVK